MLTTHRYPVLQLDFPPLSISTKLPNNFNPKASKSQTTKPHKTNTSSQSPSPIHTKNPNAVYREIQKLCFKNNLKQSLTILNYLTQQRIPVNVTTFAALLSACVRKKSMSYGKLVHSLIRLHGLGQNEFLRGKIVYMYASCGSLRDAKLVLDEFGNESVYVWNELIRGSGGWDNVGRVVSEMRMAGVELNEYGWCGVVKSLVKFRDGLTVHGLLVKNGWVRSDLVRTGLVDLYFKCGRARLAGRVFEEVGVRDVVVWGVVISGLARNGMKLEALECVRTMVCEGERVVPSLVLLTTILTIVGDVSVRRLGQEVHAQMLKNAGYSREKFIMSALVDMYCKCGDMGSGRRVFYGSVERNCISWTALMSGYAANGRLEQALRTVAWMQQEGYRPDFVAVATALPVCAELGALKQGMEIHAYAIKNCFLPSVSISTSLMIMYSKCGFFDYSYKIFRGMDQRNVISWTAMIDSFLRNGRPHEALDIFRSMQLSKQKLDSVAAARIMSVCRELKYLKLGKEVHGYILKKSLESDPFVSAETLRMYGHCGSLNYARLVFDAVIVKGAMTWTAIIEAYGCSGMFQDAINLFDQMRTGGFKPNSFTFNVVLCICDQAGFADDIVRIFNLLTREYKIKPSKEQYSIIIGLLDRLGRLEEAHRYKKMSSAM